MHRPLEFLVPQIQRLDDGDWQMTCRHPDQITTVFTGHSWADVYDQTGRHIRGNPDHKQLRSLTLALRESAKKG